MEDKADYTERSLEYLRKLEAAKRAWRERQGLSEAPWPMDLGPAQRPAQADPRYDFCPACGVYSALAGCYDLAFINQSGKETLLFGVPAYLCQNQQCHELLLERRLRQSLGGAALGRCRFAIASDRILLK